MPKKTKMRDHASDLTTRVGPAVESAREKAAPLLADARDKAAPLVAEAREKAAPLVAEARDRTAPALHEAKDRLTTDVLPVLTAAVAAAGAATEEVRGETKKRGKAVAAALKGDLEPPKQTHRLRNFLMLLGLGGVVAFVVKKMSDREPTTAWQSSYSPTPSSSSTGAGGAAGAAGGSGLAGASSAGGAHKAEPAADEATDDAGGASPDVAAADAAASPHQPTTPDDPAETIDVSQK